MKKVLLSLTLVIMTLSSVAQGLYYHPDFYFDKMSPNGKWLSTHTMGTLYIYSRVDSTYREYLASDDAVTEYYATGIGNCWSNDGILVGSVNDRDCAYWQNDEWHELPIKPENKTTNLANGITPDGSRIVGSVGLSSMNMYSEQMLKPVYWDRAADGSYEEYKELPFPAKDFCGRTPQYITAIAVSDDGKTIIGNVVDWSGFYIYPIIYTQGNDGEWSYRTIDEGVLYPEGTDFGTWPGEEPIKPDGTAYMNEQELAVYNEDYNEYMNAYNRFLNGEIDWEDVPAEPDPADYIVERLDEYEDAMAKYTLELQRYYNNSENFENNLISAMNGYSFTFNNLYLSGNGKYMSTTIRYADVSNPLNPRLKYAAVKIDLSNDDAITGIKDTRDMLASTIMNDGRMIVQTPAYAYARNSFIVSSDVETLTPFVDYITSVNSYVGKWVKEKSTFDVLYADSYDDFGNPNIVIAEDSIVAGSVFCNSEGTIFTSFMYDEWSESVGINFVRQFSYQIDFTEDTGVENIKQDAIARAVYVANNTLYINNGVSELTIYDMQGSMVLNNTHPTEQMTLNLSPGVYVVRALYNNTPIINKIVIH